MIKSLKKKLGFFLRNYKLYRYHLKQLTFKKAPKKKQIIICFNGVVPHGGLVDRLKGIISFYEVAKTLDYDFKILFDYPFHLPVFLQPNSIDWDVTRRNVRFYFGQTYILNCVNRFDINPLELIKSSNKKQFLVYANIDYMSHLHSDKPVGFTEDLWRLHFNFLFKKSKLLNSKLAEIAQGEYICFHTRFTSLMGDFVDSTTKELTGAEKDDLLNRLKYKVEALIASSGLPCYAFSDSQIFLKFISETTKVTIVDGVPFHMDSYKDQADLEAHLKTLIDFFMISESSAVYFIIENPMYMSAFSKYAAIIGGKPFKILD